MIHGSGAQCRQTVGVGSGPGEAREADIAIAGGKGRFALYVNGCRVATVPQAHAAATVFGMS